MSNAAATAIARGQNGLRGAVNAFGLACIAAVRTHRLYLLGIAGFVPFCLAAGALTDSLDLISIRFHASGFLFVAIAFATCFSLGYAIWALFRLRTDGSLFRAMATDFRDRFLSAPRLAGFIAATAPLPLFFSTFSSYKRLIPEIVPFSFDPAFARIDQWLHGGHHAYELIQPLLASPAVTSGLSALYNVWFFVLFGSFVWQAFSRRSPELRMQFLLAFVGTWLVLGVVFATALSSAGPVYYTRVTGLADPYTPLFQYLHAAHAEHFNFALPGHDLLWRIHEARGTMLGSGISAMPSLHVGMAALLVMLGWRVSRLAGIGYTLFAVVILIGSVHLGWHYAIDGYLAALLVPAIWWAAGKLARR